MLSNRRRIVCTILGIQKQSKYNLRVRAMSLWQGLPDSFLPHQSQAWEVVEVSIYRPSVLELFVLLLLTLLSFPW
jgi:hypothetical protein